MNEIKFCPSCTSELINKQRENSIKSSCPTVGCGFVHWNNPVPVALALVEYEDKFLVTHNVDWPSWKYSLISGFIDTYEDPRDAVIREVKEELNLNTIEASLITTSIYKKLNQIMISFHVKTEGELVLNHEHDSYKLLTLEELRDWEFGEGSTPTINCWFESR